MFEVLSICTRFRRRPSWPPGIGLSDQGEWADVL